MDVPPEENKRTASGNPLALTLVLLLGIGSTAVLWHIFQPQERETAVASMGRPLIEIGGADAPAPPPTGASAAASTTQDSLGLVVGGGLWQGQRAQAPSGAGAGTAAGPTTEPRAALGTAVNSFYKLKTRYKNSVFLKGWERDFLARPDLREIDARFKRDRNVVAFLTATLRSPSFGKLVKDHAANPQMRSFVMEMAASPGVSESGRYVLQDPQVMAAAKDLRLPGMPSLGQLMAMTDDGKDPQKAVGAILASDPALQNLLGQQGGADVRRR